MLSPPDPQVQSAFRALADPSRRAILTRLADADLTIGEIGEGFDMTRAAVKKHLTILEEGGLIKVTPRGRERINQLQPMALRHAADWFDHFSRFWDNKFDALAQAIQDEKDTPK